MMINGRITWEYKWSKVRHRPGWFLHVDRDWYVKHVRVHFLHDELPGLQKGGKMITTVDGVVDDILGNCDYDQLVKLRHILDDDFICNNESLKDGQILPVQEEIDSLYKHHYRIHFSRMIRNGYGLWKYNNDLARDCLKINPTVATATYEMWKKDLTSTELQEATMCLLSDKVHPDDASKVIEIAVIYRLREMNVG